MKKIFLTLVMALVALFEAQAIPAYPFPLKVKQPDGTELTIRARGDEFYNFTTTEDGYTILQNEAGYYVYAQKQDSRLVPTTTIARDVQFRSNSDKALLSTLKKNLVDESKLESGIQLMKKRDVKMQTLAKGRRFDYSKFKGLVILVEFKDCKFKRKDAKDFYKKMTSDIGYKGFVNEDGSPNRYGEFKGSVRDYFISNSSGTFSPEFDVIGPVEVGVSVDYARGTKNASGLITLAMQKAKGLANMKDYDLDGDGNIDMTYFIFAGVGSNTGEKPNHVWPHASYLPYPLGGGVSMYRYACSCELATERGEIMDGIGTMCHEFSHVLGLPDLYDTDYGQNGQVYHPGLWDLMAGGGYLDNGRTPAGYSAYDSYSVGFTTPVVIDKPGNYTLAPMAGEKAPCYMLKSPSSKEYFLLENRQATGWDAALPGHGLLVCRVDSSNAYAWTSNRPNADTRRPYYEMLRAGGVTTSGAFADPSDPFPGTAGVPMLTNHTSPSLTNWAKKANDFELAGIEEVGQTIKFRVYKAGEIKSDVETFDTAPVGSTDSEANVQGNIAKWTFVKSQVEATQSGKGNGAHAVSMKRAGNATSSAINANGYLVGLTVFNPTNTGFAFSLQYSTDGGNNWNTANTSAGEDKQTVASQVSKTLYWKVKTSKNVGVMYRISANGGPKRGSCYIDDFTIYTDDTPALVGDINGDGKVDMADVNELIGMILDPVKMQENIADVNADGNVNVSDVTKLIDMILKGSN